jgi:hypothetical protein
VGDGEQETEQMNPLTIFALGTATGLLAQSFLRSMAKWAVRGALGLQRQMEQLTAEAMEEEQDARAAAAARENREARGGTS